MHETLDRGQLELRLQLGQGREQSNGDRAKDLKPLAQGAGGAHMHPCMPRMGRAATARGGGPVEDAVCLSESQHTAGGAECPIGAAYCCPPRTSGAASTSRRPFDHPGRGLPFTAGCRYRRRKSKLSFPRQSDCELRLVVENPVTGWDAMFKSLSRQSPMRWRPTLRVHSR